MRFEEFVEVLKKDLELTYKEVNFKVRKRRKFNDVCDTGLLVVPKKKEASVCPIIYLNDYFEMYREGMAFEEIESNICESLNKTMKEKPQIDGLEKLQDFESVKDKIIFKIINYDMNKKLLKDYPYTRILDLAYVYAWKAMDDGDILITHQTLKLWNISVEELHEVAKKNTPRLLSVQVFNMFPYLKNADEEEYERTFGDDNNLPPLYMVTNSVAVWGAGTMLYPGLLKKISERENDSDLYIIPSSCHEVIITPDVNIEDTSIFNSLIEEVNHGQEACVLSNHLYKYDANSEKILIIE